MDTSQMKVAALDYTNGIIIGREDAPVKIIEFVNLRCPFCRQWYDEKESLLNEYVAAGKLQRVIKLFDKSKPGLDKGNILHKYVPKTDGAKALAALDKIYAHQDDWGDLEDFTAIAHYAENELDLALSEDAASSEQIVAEADAAKIVFVPTMIIGEEIFDQNITTEELKALIDN